VVKPGDVVTCKVVSVDVPRKRIGLSLRLDDEAQPARGGGQGSGGQGGGGRERGSRPPRQDRRGAGSAAPAPVNSAMADALRRAGLSR
jgi:uncharacterized protein